MKYLLMYNPKSGKAKFKKKVPFVMKYFKEKNLELDVYESTRPLDLENHAAIIAGNYDCIIISGGDGSINEVINGIMTTKFRPTIGLIPSGTANDFAGSLGYKKNIKQNLKIITESKEVKMDINTLNNRYFLYALAAGVLTKVSYAIPRTKVKKYGYLAYLAEGTKDIFTEYKMEAKVTHDNGAVEGSYMLILGLSAKRVGGFTLRNIKNTRLDDGKLELSLIKTVKRFRISRLLKFFIRGGKEVNNENIHLKSTTYKIEACDTIVWNTDGEKATSGNIKIKVLHKELPVYASERSKRLLFDTK